MRVLQQHNLTNSRCRLQYQARYGLVKVVKVKFGAAQLQPAFPPPLVPLC